MYGIQCGKYENFSSKVIKVDAQSRKSSLGKNRVGIGYQERGVQHLVPAAVHPEESQRKDSRTSLPSKSCWAGSQDV